MNNKNKNFMKKALLILCLAYTSFFGMAQTIGKQLSTKNQDKEIVVLLSKIDSALTVNNERLGQLEMNNTSNGRYKLYQTENIYNLLELDTKTGIVNQVQWSLDESQECFVPINNEDLSFAGYSSGSFELYPTKNMYQFILIDTTDGRKWHIQWGMSDNKRWIRRMY